MRCYLYNVRAHYQCWCVYDCERKLNQFNKPSTRCKGQFKRIENPLTLHSKNSKKTGQPAQLKRARRTRFFSFISLTKFFFLLSRPVRGEKKRLCCCDTSTRELLWHSEHKERGEFRDSELPLRTSLISWQPRETCVVFERFSLFDEGWCVSFLPPFSSSERTMRGMWDLSEDTLAPWAPQLQCVNIHAVTDTLSVPRHEEQNDC